MATITFLSLPAEIHVSIAKYCENNDLFNLCRTSKLVKERCLWILYRHVDLLRLDRHNEGFCSSEEYDRISDAHTKSKHFIYALLSHPEHGKYVRSFKGMPAILRVCAPGWTEDTRFDKLWRAMQSLTHVQSVDLGTRNGFVERMDVPRKPIPTRLFQSATSVRLVGYMNYSLAKSILHAINPATLEHLSLDMCQEIKIFGQSQHEGMPGEDGRIIARGAISGLLTPLTGRCIALRSLILRREDETQHTIGWHEAGEEASYTEWASFIRSVQGTVEKFTFEHSRDSTASVKHLNETSGFGNGRFERLILPAIFSGTWPCLTIMTLRGIMMRRWKARDMGNPLTLIGKLRLALGADARIVVGKQARFHADLWEPFG